MADQRPPSFFHILMNPSSPHLPLPLKFVTKHLRNEILEDPIIKSANGGYLWKLKMKKFDDQSYCLVDGWCNVVKDLGLLFGEFLLFKYVGSSVFIMHIYSVNGCEKILVPKVKVVDYAVEDKENDVVYDVDDNDDMEEDEDVVYDMDDDDHHHVEDEDDVEFDDEEDHDMEEDEDDHHHVEDENDVEFDDDEDEDDHDTEEDDDVLYDVDDDDDDVEDEDDVEYVCGGDEDDDVDVDGDNGDPFFILTSSKSNKNKLLFSPSFVALTQINTRETITFKNDDGSEKEMTVQSDKKSKSTSYYVAAGWKEFQQSNGISEGDKCVFKFITSEDKIYLAKITKKKTLARPPPSAVEAPLTEDDTDDVEDDDGMDDNDAEDNNDKDEDEDFELVDEEDPFFVVTITPTHYRVLRMPADFVRLSGIDTKRILTVRSLDGNEMAMRVQFDTQYGCHEKRYFLLKGWKDFMQGTNISEGDKCLFKFITSEDKLYLAKITKQPAAAEALATEFNDDDRDENEDVEPVDDVDPFFAATMTKYNNLRLCMPTNFVRLAGIDTKENIIMISLDGNEFPMAIRKYRQKLSTLYILSSRWSAVMRSNNISQGDKCVFKYITSEDKMCLVKITKASATEVDDGMDVEDDNDIDEDGNAKPVDDADPFFVVTIIPSHSRMLLLPTDFVALARIDTKESIIIKSLDGNEMQMALQSYKLKWLTRYCFSVGWTAFKRCNNISDGDECVFKYIKSEDKMCLAKITKKITQETLLPVDNDGMDDVEKGKGEDAKLVDKDDDGDPSFILTISKVRKTTLNLPIAFVRLAGIPTKKNIIMISLDGNECQMAVRKDRQKLSTRFYLAKGWPAFKRSNYISQGDKCVFKYITSEDKMCLAKVIKAMPKEVDVVDEDPSFVVTITTTHKTMLRFCSDFVKLAGIDKKKTIVFKNLNGHEKEMVVQRDNQFKSPSYLVASGFKEFLQDTDISEGDICVFKFIRSEDKICLAKITKKKTPDIEPPVTEVDVATGDDDDADDEDVERVDDGDPLFVATISHRFMLLPPDFVALAKIDTKENIIIKSLDGNERQMAIQSYKQHSLIRYHFSIGWPAFRRSNNISEGDECEFKYIRGEDKLCLVKVTKRKTGARSPPPAVVAPETEVAADDDGIDGKDVDDDNDKDDDDDDDGNPFFVKTISPSRHRELYLPVDFVRSAGIDTKETITLLGLDGYEKEMPVRYSKSHESKRYYVAKGWPEFKRNNAISVGDKCVFKFITSDDRLCLAKINNKKTPTSPLPPAPADDDAKDETEDVDDEDPFFVVTISHKFMLWLPSDFVALAKIDTKENVTIRSLDGNERQIPMQSYKQFQLTRYHFSIGWPSFRRSNNISKGDECVFKYIRCEDKLCLVKVTKRKTQARPSPPAPVTTETEVDDDDAEDDDGLGDKDTENNNDKDEDEDADFDDDDDPFFVVIITQHNVKGYLLRMPVEFVRSAGIGTKKTITLKSLDGYEKEMPVRCDSKYHYQAKLYYLSKGWTDFARSNDISVGDKCVFKYITSEDKLCLAKITKAPTTEVDDEDVEVDRGMDDNHADKDVELVDGVNESDPAKVVKKKRGRPAKISMAENVNITVEEVVKRKRGRPPAAPRATEDVKRKRGRQPHGHSGDVEGVGKCVKVGKRSRGRPAKRLCGKAPQQKC